VACGVGLVVGHLVLRRAVRRLGGITGDVLGATAEITFTAVLLALALLP
jgi:adenosylcobinamide-GDP ribazoletransferase